MFFKAGVLLTCMMQITGHNKSETFMKYIKITEEENAVLTMENVFFS
jgi:hypothetical protein